MSEGISALLERRNKRIARERRVGTLLVAAAWAAGILIVVALSSFYFFQAKRDTARDAWLASRIDQPGPTNEKYLKIGKVVIGWQVPIEVKADYLSQIRHDPYAGLLIASAAGTCPRQQLDPYRKDGVGKALYFFGIKADCTPTITDDNLKPPPP